MTAGHWPHPVKNGVGVGGMEDGGRNCPGVVPLQPQAFSGTVYICKAATSLYLTCIANRASPLPSPKKENMGLRGGKDELGDWDWHIYATVYKIGNE